MILDLNSSCMTYPREHNYQKDPGEYQDHRPTTRILYVGVHVYQPILLIEHDLKGLSPCYAYYHHFDHLFIGDTCHQRTHTQGYIILETKQKVNRVTSVSNCAKAVFEN